MITAGMEVWRRRHVQHVLTPPKTPHSQPPKPHRWSMAEYREIDKTGLFQDVKTMLLYGEVCVMLLPSPLIQPYRAMYRSRQTFDATYAVSLLAAPNALVKVEDLLPKLTP